MSCLNEEDCREPQKRRIALLVLALMGAAFIALSIASFLPQREQAQPDTTSFVNYDAIYGKRVFQAYNCMGCHTIVGNGAYFGPDLTDTYTKTGPAWLAAFLPSAAGWPTAAAVQAQLLNSAIASEAGTADIAEYQQKYPEAAERIVRRGGHKTLMPNLPMDAAEIHGLIAFMKYTSNMNTEGWPPKPKVDGLALLQARQGTAKAATVINSIEAEATITATPVERGRTLVAELGCTACHTTDTSRTVGPGWGELAMGTRILADGSSIEVSEEYLIEAIRNPDAKVLNGYPAGVMPAYDAMINESDMQAIISYLLSLKGD